MIAAVDSPWNWMYEGLNTVCSWCRHEGHSKEWCAYLRKCMLCGGKGHIDEDCHQPHAFCFPKVECNVPLLHIHHICYDPPQYFSSPSYTATTAPIPSLILPTPPAPPATLPAVAPAARPATPLTPAARPPSPMQVDPANVPLPPSDDATPAHALQRLPSPPTIAIRQPPLAIST